MALLTRTIEHPLRVNPLHIYRSLFALSAYGQCAVFLDRLLDIILRQLTSDQHNLMFF